MSEKLSKKEKLVYDIIQDYFKKKRPIEIKKLVPLITSRLSRQSIDINSNKVKLIIKSLKKKNLIVEGSILTKDDILKNETRKKIYEFICKNSAVYFHQIMKGLDLPTHSVIWHINFLHLFNFIERIKIEKHYNHYIYFDKKLDSQEAKIIYFTNHKKCKRIIEHLKNENEGCTKTQLSKELGMHPNTIKKYINELEVLNIVSKTKSSNKSLYYLPSE